MRFTGVQEVRSPVHEVWAGLHDVEVLGVAIPGCEQLASAGAEGYAATLAVRVGPVADTYRGAFAVEDLCPSARLRVAGEGQGRCGRLQVDLHVRLEPGRRAGTTLLRYDAEAGVGGLVARLGSVTLTAAGAHLTARFFRDLDRALVARQGRVGSCSAGGHANVVAGAGERHSRPGSDIRMLQRR